MAVCVSASHVFWAPLLVTLLAKVCLRYVRGWCGGVVPAQLRTAFSAAPLCGARQPWRLPKTFATAAKDGGVLPWGLAAASFHWRRQLPGLRRLKTRPAVHASAASPLFY